MTIIATIILTILIYLIFVYITHPKIRLLAGSLAFLGLIASVFIMMIHF